MYQPVLTLERVACFRFSAANVTLEGWRPPVVVVGPRFGSLPADDRCAVVFRFAKKETDQGRHR